MTNSDSNRSFFGLPSDGQMKSFDTSFESHGSRCQTSNKQVYSFSHFLWPCTRRRVQKRRVRATGFEKERKKKSEALDAAGCQFAIDPAIIIKLKCGVLLDRRYKTSKHREQFIRKGKQTLHAFSKTPTHNRSCLKYSSF